MTLAVLEYDWWQPCVRELVGRGKWTRVVCQARNTHTHTQSNTHTLQRMNIHTHIYSSRKCVNQGMWAHINSPFSDMGLSVSCKKQLSGRKVGRETEWGRENGRWKQYRFFLLALIFQGLSPLFLGLSLKLPRCKNNHLFRENVSIPYSYFRFCSYKRNYTSAVSLMCHPTQEMGLVKIDGLSSWSHANNFSALSLKVPFYVVIQVNHVRVPLTSVQTPHFHHIWRLLLHI